jgi:hypothetical protein
LYENKEEIICVRGVCVAGLEFVLAGASLVEVRGFLEAGLAVLDIDVAAPEAGVACDWDALALPVRFSLRFWRFLALTLTRNLF